MRDFVHQRGFVDLDGLLHSTNQILLGFLVLVSEPDDEVGVLLYLLLFYHHGIKQELAQDDWGLVSDLQTISFSEDFLCPGTLVDGDSVLLDDDKLVEDVDALLFRFLQIIVDDETTETSGQFLHSLSDGLVRHILAPVSLVIIIVVSVFFPVIRILLPIFIFLLLFPVFLLRDGGALG